jgi:integrase
MIARLTKRAVDAARAGAQDYVLWDKELSGFGLRVKATSIKTYIVQYKYHGRSHRLSIGRHGIFTPEQARKEAMNLLRSVKLGRNPAAERAADRHGETVADLCERYLTHHARVHKRHSSVQSDESLIRCIIRPRLGTRRVRDLERQDVWTLHQALVDTPYRANRALALLSKMLNVAELWGLRPDGTNPCRHVARYAERPRRRYLSAAELTELGTVLSEADRTRTETQAVVAAIRLLLFTGCRLSEVLTLCWEHVDLARGVLALPESKTGQKDVILNPGALEVLSAIERDPQNPYVIRGARLGQHLVNLEKPWGRIRQRAALAGVRLHDLRHTHASIAAGLGASLPVIGALLGHTVPQTTARYAHLQTDPLREVSASVSARLKAALAARDGANADTGVNRRGV